MPPLRWICETTLSGAPRSSRPTAQHQPPPDRQSQAQLWNRIGPEFLQTQGPVGPEGIASDHSDFARRKSSSIKQECVPRNGVREKRPMGLGGAKRSRSPSGASPGAFCLLFRHGKRRSPPAGGEIPCAPRDGAPGRRALRSKRKPGRRRNPPRKELPSGPMRASGPTEMRKTKMSAKLPLHQETN